MMNHNAIRLSMLALLFELAMSVHGQVTLFQESFESGNLSQWTGKFGPQHQGKIVNDPLNPANHVLTFTGVNAAGDIFSAARIPVLGTQRFVLSFDFLALSTNGVQPSEYGGFAGITLDPLGVHYWLAGTYLPAVNTPASVATLLATDGQWHHYEVDFTEILVSNHVDSFQVMLEDWYDRGSIPGDIFFDNVKVLLGGGSPSLDQLIGAVQDSDLAANRKRPLLASLEAAQASSARGDIEALNNQLRAFQHKVVAQVDSLDVALANDLIALAEQIIHGSHSTSGVVGQVPIYGCAAVRLGDACHFPYQTGIAVVTDHGNLVAELRTAADGSFEVSLDPGDYVLVPDGAGTGRLPSVEVYPIHVSKERFSPVVIEYDSGIR
jgi:hypothetical protein